MSAQEWNANYIDGEMPWDTREPDPILVDLVRSGTLRAGRGLEIGSGTGTNAIWLASRGFEMLGMDIAPKAVEMAREKAAGTTKATFSVGDILSDPIPANSFDFVFDRGCFHIFDEARQRTSFAQRVSDALRPGGLWLSLIGSTEGPPRNYGPPRRSAHDIVGSVEPALEILRLEGSNFAGDQTGAPAAWICLARKRESPAQESTKR